MKIYVDTNIVVANVVESHIHHQPSTRLFDLVIAGRHEAFISAHGLSEIFSVLTRTPFIPPLRPAEVWQILADDFLPVLNLVELSAVDYREIVRECAQSGFGGGRVHDVGHLRAAQKAACQRIYTFDVKAFQQLAPNLSSRIMTP